MTPSPTALHQAAVGAFYRRLWAYVRGQRIGQALMSPSDVEAAPDFLSQPDLYVIPPDEWRRVGRPGHIPVHRLLLVVEVVSPSSSRHDRVTKRRHYQRSVPEYWIVDVDAEIVERWRSADVRPEIAAQSLTWLPEGAAESLEIDLVELFREVTGDE